MLLLCSICHILFAASTVELQLPEETLDNRETVLRRLITIITIIVITIITVTITTIMIRLKIDWVAGKVSELLAVRIIRPHFVTTSVFVLPSNTKTSNTKTLSQHQFGLLSLCHNIISPPDKDLLFTTLLYSRSASKICFLQLFKVTFSIFTQPNTDTAVNLNP